MPATIQIRSGISSGAEYWIERPVLRVGSDPDCEICLPSADLTGHAVTVAYRSDQYQLYNRCQQPLSLNGEAIEVGGSRVWNEGEALELPEGTVLSLEIEGDPAPAPRPTSIDVSDYEVDEEPETESPSEPSPEVDDAERTKTIMQLVVIGICVLGSIMLLVYKSQKDSGPQVVQEIPEFAEIVKQGLDDPQLGGLLERLQFAETAIVRGNLGEARKRYERLRNYLIQRDEPTAAESRFESDVLGYVEYRLGQLGS